MFLSQFWFLITFDRGIANLKIIYHKRTNDFLILSLFDKIKIRYKISFEIYRESG